MKKFEVLKTIFSLIIIIILLIAFVFKMPSYYPQMIEIDYKKDYFGVTFSKKFTEELGLDWKEVYKAILDDLNVKYIRIPVYWDEIEKEQGKFDFSNYDYIFDEGKKRDVKFIANIGWRLPRWPECHEPPWTEDLPIDKIKENTLIMLKEAIIHFKERPEIMYWQVENEPLLDSFGECPRGDLEFLIKEVALVRNLDDREIILTASGELSAWGKEAQLGDIFGTTLYRVVWSPYFGYTNYPIPYWFYSYKAELLKIDPENRFIMELQLEPWTPEGKIIALAPKEYNKSMDIDQFKANIKYAIDVDWKQAYAWGVEWWYWQYRYGDIRYYEIAKEMFK